MYLLKDHGRDRYLPPITTAGARHPSSDLTPQPNRPIRPYAVLAESETGHMTVVSELVFLLVGVMLVVLAFLIKPDKVGNSRFREGRIFSSLLIGAIGVIFVLISVMMAFNDVAPKA